MLPINFPVVLLSALIPLLMGLIWYHPKVFGNLWMRESGVIPDEDAKKRMPRIMALLFLCSIAITFVLQFIVVHQFHFYSMLENDPQLQIPGSELHKFYTETMAKYGMNFRTFKHGAFHGSFTGIFVALPIISFSALFEKRSWKYIAIHTGYWVVCLGLMGGIISAFPGN
jgi:hypothetical protein